MLPHRIDGLLRSEPRGAPGRGVRGVLERVVERGELRGVAAQRGGGEPVREPAVLGQQRAMQVGTDDGAVRTTADALVAGAAVVSMTFRTRPSGRSAAPRRVRPPWFSKPASTLGSPPRSTSMATLPISRGPSSRTVSRSTRPTPGKPLTSEFVGVAEQLVAAADGEDHLAGGGRGVQRVALDRREVLGAQRLVAVLAAADVEEVVGVGVELVAEAGAGELEARARATRSACAAASRLPRSA